MAKLKQLSRVSIAVLLLLATPCRVYSQIPLKPHPEMNFSDENGVSHSLDELHGQVIVLNIWATWCRPCRKEMPGLSRLQQRLQKRNFAVLAVSADKNNAVNLVKAFYNASGISNLDVLVGSSQSIARLGIAAFPTSIIIDAEGNEVMRVRGYVDWDNLRVRRVIMKLLEHTPKGAEPNGDNLPL